MRIHIPLPRICPAIVVLHIIAIASPAASGQEKASFGEFRKLSRPEKCWLLRHPFLVNKIYLASREAIMASDSVMKGSEYPDLRKNGNNDAFRHAYWMALLSGSIGPRKAYRFGFVHEKGNYVTWKKNMRKGLTDRHDEAAMEMDLWNNCAGIRIVKISGASGKKVLAATIADSIDNGMMRVIRTDDSGRFLDRYGRIIPHDSLVGRWVTPRCLVPSGR